jgi:hypothetical protein
MTTVINQKANTPSTMSRASLASHFPKKHSCEIPMSPYVSLHPLFLRSFEEKKNKRGCGGPGSQRGWSNGF